MLIGLQLLADEVTRAKKFLGNESDGFHDETCEKKQSSRFTDLQKSLEKICKIDIGVLPYGVIRKYELQADIEFKIEQLTYH